MSETRTEEEMLDLVGAWHNGAADDKPLHEFLGMTWVEYAAWVECKPSREAGRVAGEEGGA